MVLAAYTYLAGLRAPALIAFVKDTLIYVTVIVAIFYIPAKLGGWGHIFGAADAHLKTTNPTTGKPFGSLVIAARPATGPTPRSRSARRWRCSCTRTRSPGCFAARRRDVIRRNVAILPAYSLVLGLIALFGYMALATPAVNAGVKAGGGNTQLSVPLLFEHMFPSWFAGIGYSAIVIGALVPAAIMSIAAANLFTRNIYKEFFRPDASPAEETRVARLASLVVKVGALVFVLALEQDVLDQPAAARRGLDPADLPGDRGRPVHALVPPLGADHRLGRWRWCTARSRRTARQGTASSTSAPRRRRSSGTSSTSRSPRSCSTW